MLMALNRQPGAPATDLLAICVHDLRQPLTIVRVSTELLRRRVKHETRMQAAWLDRAIVEIEEAELWMEQLIDEIVDLARIQAGNQLPLNRRPTDLVEVATHVVDAMQASSAGQRVRLDVAQPSAIGCWDAARLRRVLENVLGNAIKYSPPDRKVVMRVGHDLRSDGDWAVLTVRDHGRGIPAADLPYIFEPFRRGSNIGEVAGSGLGLASVKRIVEAHGGSIAVQSREGEGTAVTVRLPRH